MSLPDSTSGGTSASRAHPLLRPWSLFFVLFILATSLAAWATGANSQAAGAGATEPAPDLSAYPWFYLRAGRPLGPEEAVVELVAVGDVMLGRAVAAEPAPFAAAAPWLAAADLALGNLEGVIVAGGVPQSAPEGEAQPIILRMPPPAAAALGAAGFDLLGLANNHSLDYGPAGLAETAGRLQAAGITPLGLDDPVVREVGGVKIAFLAFNDVHGAPLAAGSRQEPAQWDELAATEAIRAARRTADVVVVSLHWGYEYELRPDPAQVSAAGAMQAAGADVVLGHHPHVVQEVAVGEASLTAYSLGNFVFDQGQGETGQGLALRLFLDRQGLRAAQALPLWAGPRPRLMSPDEASALLARIQPPLRRLAWACDGSACERVAGGETEEGGRFWAGQIDLTGDGRPEIVRRVGEQVTVVEEGAVVWHSPPEWHVQDVALGDPNDDGRYEIMLAILKADPDGYLRSQPYLVGYRGGAYKLLWGGRPVNDPIQELEVGDVDGDGVDELVVIEAGSDGSGDSVAVWRWTGWSFGLLWRGESGRYQDLVLLPAEGDGRIISVALKP